MQSLRPVLYSRFLMPVLSLLALILMLLLARLLASLEMEHSPLPERSFNAYQCGSADSTPVRELKILDTFLLNTDELADLLCHEGLVDSGFSRVTVAWQHRDHVDLRGLLDLEYDFFLAKPELLQRIELVEPSAYKPMARHRSYTSGLISVKEMPALTDNYFREKRLGLIDDPTSLSGYQVPINALQKSHIKDDWFEIVFYKSHNLLYQALLKGEVDVIASYVPEEETLAGNRLMVLPLMERLLGPQWYIHPDLLDTPAHCLLEKKLKDFAGDHVNPYISGLVVVRECLNE